MHFLYAWLVSNNKLQTWIKKYTQLTDEHITLAFFDRVIEPKPENMWEYEVYKLLTDELFLLLENAKRYSKNKSSNMEALPKEDIIHIFEEYIKQHGKRIPTVTDTFNFNNEVYEIGAFVNKLSLIYAAPEGSIKNSIEKLFNQSLTMPGLMFNFNDVYEQSDNVPKRYGFGQEYIYIIHTTFNVPYINIPQQDKNAIIQLILTFNDYYKKEAYKRCGKDCNAPLFCCSLTCILTQLPYFHKYKDILKFIPTKDRGTSSHIKSEWFKFICKQPDIIKRYAESATAPSAASTTDTSTKNAIITDMITQEEIHFYDDMVF